MKTFIEQEPFVLKPLVGDIAFFDDDALEAERALLSKLEASPPGSLVLVDVFGVRLASAAARRLLKRAILRIGAGELRDRYLVLGDLGESEDNVQIMLQGEDLLLVERSDKLGPRLLGDPDVAVQQTYDFLLRSPVSTASEVSEKLRLSSVSAATNRLTNLTRLGLARRIDERTVAGGGREFVYAAVR